MSTMTFIITLHIAAGTIALASFWFAALAPKGSRPHVLAGRTYLLAMAGIIVSGIPLVARFAIDGAHVFATFFGYLLLLVSFTCWTAWRAVRDRRYPARYMGPAYWALLGLVAASGLAVMGLGLSRGSPILLVFGAIGPLAALGGVRVRRRIRNDRRWWLKEHFGAMIGNGVATHVAFLSIGLRTLVPGADPATLAYLAWFAPLTVAVFAGWWLNRRYGAETAFRARVAPRTPAMQHSALEEPR